ncbi:hypothetical protein IKE79_02030 [Candidatus Saccharibacteria bacterium]|nr:hypothetical protein [Candidatus Saccharibacteria bacterium]
MAANKQTIKLPNKVINSNWRDDIDIDYATYGNDQEEAKYISPNKVSKESIKLIKRRNQRIGAKALFFARTDRLAA